MVLPIPRSSLTAGITILIFRFIHSRYEYKNKGVKRILKKKDKKRDKKGVKPLYVCV
jgi:hypothetical protein